MITSSYNTTNVFLHSRFHFPYGNPVLNPYSDGNLPRFSEEFRKHKNSSVTLDELGDILKVSQKNMILYFTIVLLPYILYCYDIRIACSKTIVSITLPGPLKYDPT